MQQGITTRYMGLTYIKGPRIKAIARKAVPNRDWKEMSLTIPYSYEGTVEVMHTEAAKALAMKLGWSGLWVGGGKPEEDGYQYVCVGNSAMIQRVHGEGHRQEDLREDQDWFYVPALDA